MAYTLEDNLNYFKNKAVPNSMMGDAGVGTDFPSTLDGNLEYFKNKFSTTSPNSSAQLTNQVGQSRQATILPNPEPITQRFGNYNPKVEVMSKGRALGTNIAADVGTPVALPPGTWTVDSTYTNAKGGYIGNSQNSGYGNAVKARNNDTGEILHFTHLSGVNVMPGQILNGGIVIGKTGATGNVTGPHLNLEYYNAQGQLGDVLQSPYGAYIQTE